MSKQRRHTRYPIQVPVMHRAGDAGAKPGVGWTRDVSEGGFCIELADVLQPQMSVRLRLKTDRGAIEADGQVAWVGESRGKGGGTPHGIALTQMAPGHRQALADLVVRKGELLPVQIRVPLKLSVQLRSKGRADEPLEGWTGNLSRGGMLLHLPKAFEPATQVEFTLHTAKGPLTLNASVVWVDPPERRRPGEPISHGVQFAGIGWPTLLALGHLLAVPE
jgi:hypothetical protein